MHLLGHDHTDMTHGLDPESARLDDDGGRILSTVDNTEPDARVVWAPQSAARLGGVWWPRTQDAARELIALLPSAEVRLGPGVTRVSLSMSGWSPEQPRHLRTSDRLVRLGWFRTLDPTTATFGRGNSERTTVLVIPPDTDPAMGRRLLKRLATADPWPGTVSEALALGADADAPSTGGTT